MSFFNFIRTALSAIKRFFAKVPDEIKEFTAKALEITTEIKRIVDSDGVATITALIPGTWDDKIVAGVKLALSKGIPQIVKVEGCGTDLQCYLNLLIEFIREQAPKTRNSVFMGLAQLIVAMLDGNKLKQSQYDAFTQLGYSANKDLV